MTENVQNAEVSKQAQVAEEFIIKRPFNSQLATGIIATVFCFVVTMIYWPLWGMAAKAFITSVAGPVLQTVDAKIASKYVSVFTEGTFFWMVINAWVWLTLAFGNYGKTALTTKQPLAGIWYAIVGIIAGIVGFIILVGFLGLWWKPFSLAILFTPATPEDLHLAIEGWEAGNFFALMVIIAQIPFISLFQKWPFAGNIKAPWDGYGVLLAGTVFSLITWFGLVITSFMKLSIGEHSIVSVPMGSWPTLVAFCEWFIFWFLMPAEGGESYPQKLFAKKQPYMGIVGLIIAFVMSHVFMIAARPVLTALDLMPGAPVDLLSASIGLSVVTTMLVWHHLFDDFPSAQMVPNQAARVLCRIAIWLVLGCIMGIIWIKTFKMLPFGGTDYGLGWPTMGILAGQFAFLMVVLYCNTFFDKWPVVRKVSVKK